MGEDLAIAGEDNGERQVSSIRIIELINRAKLVSSVQKGALRIENEEGEALS